MRQTGRQHQWWAGAACGALILSAVGCSSAQLGKVAEHIGTTAQGVITAGQAPDATGLGERGVVMAEYRFDAAVDPTVYTDRMTDVRARTWRPASFDDDERFPLVIFLHGNHATCGTFTCAASECGVFLELPNGPRIDDRIDYTTTGTCPRAGEAGARSDYIEAPSYLGYSYLAEQLASHGYFVVSINANRGITAGAAQDLGTPGNPFIEDRGLNLGRGRLVLKHLERLSNWNRGIEPTPGDLGIDLRGRIDFGQVGLVGHSRGGEGVRAAYNIYTGRNTDINPYSSINWRARIADTVNIRGIFEIAPVDRQTVRTLNAEGTTWSVMLPGCDGDVINQQGMWPFDRMMKSFTETPARQKAFYYVVGANHNYWNTEWQFSDGSGCINPAVQLFVTDPNTGVLPGVTGSARQRTTGSASILALIRGAVRPSDDEDDEDAHFLRNFDPQYALPSVVTDVALIERGFNASPSSSVTEALEDFGQPTGTSDRGFANQTSGGVTVQHFNSFNAPGFTGIIEHGIPFLFREPDDVIPAPRHRTPLPAFLPAGRVSWSSAGADVFFQINLAAAGQGIDLSGNKTLDFRVDRESPKRTALNPTASTNFHIQLVEADGTLSRSVAVSDFIDLIGPFGTEDADFGNPALPDGYHVNMPTARVPMGAFGPASILRDIHGIRFTFDDTPTGTIYMTNFRASQKGLRSLGDDGDDSSEAAGAAVAMASIAPANIAPQIISEGNVVEDVHLVSAPGSGARSNGYAIVQLTVFTPKPVLVGDEMLQMSIGTEQCDGWYADSSLQRITFRCNASALEEGAPIRVGNNPRMAWDFGTYSNVMLR